MGGERSARGQIAIEYLIIMGFALLIIIPLIVVYYTQADSLNEETVSATVNRAAATIAEAADTVFYLGAPSSRTVVVDLPDNVEAVAIQGNSVTFTVASTHGEYDQNAWSHANLTGGFNTTEGPHVLVIAALDDGRVNITERGG